MEYKYADFTGELINAAMEVHRILGNDFQEVIYQRAYEIELNQKNLFTVCREVEMPVRYKGHVIGTRRVDFLINDLISIEIKALIKLEDVHLAQALNYLEAYNLEVGLLINFGAKSLEFKRLFNKKYNVSQTG
ncbi:MAG TPA: GxxExxY protein [Ferruginibacter sp.]|nr:GxxExxY protein [Ferruginibacter sp.]